MGAAYHLWQHSTVAIMQARSPGHIRNIALVGHPKSGKTTLTESVLFAAGALSRPGRVEDANTVSDWDEQERRHGHSIYTSLVTVEWGDCSLNFLDTPGFPDFEGEVVSACAAAEIALITLDGHAGIESGTESGWARAEAAGTPARLFGVTHLDRDGVDFLAAVEALRGRYGARVAPFALLGEDGEARSLLDEGPAGAPESVYLAAREQLIEAAAELDDDLLEQYLDGQTIGRAQLAETVRRGLARNALVPVVPLVATTGAGVRALLDALVAFGPSPLEWAYPLEDGESRSPTSDGPLVVRVVKTVADPFVGHLSYVKVLGGSLHRGDRLKNCRSDAEDRAAHLFHLTGREQFETDVLEVGDIGAIPKLTRARVGDVLVAGGAAGVQLRPLALPEPYYRSTFELAHPEDVDRLAQALGRMCELDPTMRIDLEAGTGELVLLTQGDVQAGNVAERLQRDGLTVTLVEPRVPYRETIRAAAQAEYRHKKQTGGRGQFGHVVLRVEPAERGEGFEFHQQVVGGSVPKQYIPAVEQGVVEALGRGPLARAPLVDLRVTLLDGSSHSVDSSEIAFKIAGEQALQEAVRQAAPVLLEPMMRLQTWVSNDLVGEVTALLTGSRGNVLGMQLDGDLTLVEALAPLSEVQRFAPQLRRFTHGRGRFAMAFDHYAEAPQTVQDHVAALGGASSGS